MKKEWSFTQDGKRDMSQIALVGSNTNLELIALLEKKGHSVLRVSASHHLIPFLEKQVMQRKKIEVLLVLDDCQPSSGFVLCDQIKANEQWKEIPLFLLFSEATVDRVALHQCSQTAANAYLHLTQDQETLFAMLESISSSAPEKTSESPTFPYTESAEQDFYKESHYSSYTSLSRELEEKNHTNGQALSFDSFRLEENSLSKQQEKQWLQHYNQLLTQELLVQKRFQTLQKLNRTLEKMEKQSEELSFSSYQLDIQKILIEMNQELADEKRLFEQLNDEIHLAEIALKK